MKSHLLKVRVDAIRDEADGIRSFGISRIDGKLFDPYEPGAHIDVMCPAGMTRQYSLCGDPRERAAQLFAVKREAASRGGSRSLHDDVQVGSELTVSAPRNLFRLAPEARDHLLIAAGIGVTPLLSMAYQLVRTGARFVLHYFARGEKHAAFVEQLTRAPFAPDVRFHFGIELAELDDVLAACFADANEETHVYTCGPGPFMDRVVAIGQRRLAADSIHLERFSAGPATTELSAAGEPESFEVRAASSGRTVRVGRGVSIVAALATIGIDVDTSCEEGVCGTCMIDVLDGEPDHRDHCLSAAERAANKVVCCCVSRSRTPVLVLDV